MTKFEKITLSVSILTFIIGCSIASYMNNSTGELVGIYSTLISVFGIALVLLSGGYNSKGNIFDNHTNINITIHDSDKKD